MTVAALKSSRRGLTAGAVQFDELGVTAPLKLTTGRAPAVAASKRGEPNTLGTLAFTHQFQACLEAALRSNRIECLPLSQWHKSAPVVEYLKARVGHKLVAAVLAKTAAVERLKNDPNPEYDDWRVYRKVYDDTLKQVISRFGFTHRQVAKTEQQILRLVQTELMAHRRWRLGSHMKVAIK